ncbi:23S rRNA (adenine(2503)-C(2))-methyltransferase RlmN [Candidatus Woesearchaeota archaeon]|jgi:23S rRNA (adenine2503-C2)-methyltransferase|nr:23S rRNA (adenine(2503)-C(2))-methyltransferase RlmN [Candidatus Woesearchaeota archaeon]MBT3538170.1 23S rRNA (adenine(2503)-C(2))-methyltransferase RlmN [Candidatus Woesearchaeota archaeon]MBT4697471.1 23S rRNA (adenine(2503)-C(2))-methyltransferase RlmN [Candidatus Woesearchaeota archaeon]MBT4716885.1 23S rRNA (adenine(2503)-C(2))-methyltransferase RlmN [Candidatus Woesearchaeota archaeon]MBT7105839.1 23S rRNA (adenine(2503)-C(2))-methyltransferase RlmN [Candidatus Woesearchaeota archaeon
MTKLQLKSLTHKELQSLLKKLNINPFNANKIFKHIYHKQENIETTNLPDKDRLLNKIETKNLRVIKKIKSKDKTTKFLFQLADKNKIESVLIPQRNKYCACISTQVGCALRCKFCISGRNGLKRNLETYEIIEQVITLNKEKPIYSIVFMGSGEPFHNYKNIIKAIHILNNHFGFNFGQKHITVSTSGIPKKIVDFYKDTTANLAISLNATNNKLRSQLMPINNKYGIRSILNACKNAKTTPRRRIMIEYILFKDLNDSLEDANKLTKLLQGFHCAINLIPFNEHPHSKFKAPNKKQVELFKETLRNKKFKVFIRESHGQDINAACGMLSN